LHCRPPLLGLGKQGSLVPKQHRLHDIVLPRNLPQHLQINDGGGAFGLNDGSMRNRLGIERRKTTDHAVPAHHCRLNSATTREHHNQRDCTDLRKIGLGEEIAGLVNSRLRGQQHFSKMLADQIKHRPSQRM